MIILQIRSWEGRRTSLGRYPHELAFHGISCFYLHTWGCALHGQGLLMDLMKIGLFLSFYCRFLSNLYNLPRYMLSYGRW